MGAALQRGRRARTTSSWTASSGAPTSTRPTGTCNRCPATGAHRLRADESGFANLFLAGDWINCGLNAGCIEAAVMAGTEAANAVRRRPLTDGHQRNVVRPRGFMTASDGHRGDLSELQRRGVATATEVFERLIEELDGVERRRLKADAGFKDSDDGGPADLPALRAAVARTIDVYADLFRRTLELYADVVESIARSNGPAAPEPGADGRAGGPRRVARRRSHRDGVDAQRDGGAPSKTSRFA